ncbi:Protein of unknown function [Arthrobacter sp. ok909]|uniref:glycosyltransferase family 87 protein n=1 Tax=Arthrobacter sp. ok909 TaxID=1761746 RepID=UPI000887B415|nr:glycosyltransferase family 87 protein [Arthrobacter sp. ok909]SDP37873.1 Protein of unknown function [Arthrobacter sp. ok909]
MTKGRQVLAILVQRIDSFITPDRLRVYPMIFAVMSGVALLASSVTRVVLPAAQGPFLPDYLAHWTGGGLLLAGEPAALYDPQVQQAFQERALGPVTTLAWFVSPAVVAASYAPLALMPYNLSALIWLAVSAALLVACTLSLSLFAPQLMLHKRKVVLLAVFASPAVFELLGGGQDSAFVLAVWLLGIRFLSAGHNYSAGAILGLGFAKPQLFVLVPIVLLATRNFRALAGFVAVFSLLAGVSVGLVGVDGMARWVSALSSPLYTEQVQQGQAWKMIGLPSLVQGLLPPAWAGWTAPVLTVAALPVGAAILLFHLCRTRKRPADPVLVWLTTLATTVVFSPHIATYDGVLLVPVLAYLLEYHSSPMVRASTVGALGLLWLGPVFHQIAVQLAVWPLDVIDAPWAALPLAVLWRELLRPLSTFENPVKTMHPHPQGLT